jgi:hypothetical protein
MSCDSLDVTSTSDRLRQEALGEGYERKG